MSYYDKLTPEDRKYIFASLNGGKKPNKAIRTTFYALWYMDKEILKRGQYSLCVWQRTKLLREGRYTSSQLTIKPV